MRNQKNQIMNDLNLTRMASLAVIVGAITVVWSFNLRLVDITRLPERFDTLEKRVQQVQEKQDILSKNLHILANAMGVKLLDDSAPVGSRQPVKPDYALEKSVIVPERSGTFKRQS